MNSSLVNSKLLKIIVIKKIEFFATPFDIESVDFLSSIKVKYFKIASFDISNNELIDKIISKKNHNNFNWNGVSK